MFTVEDALIKICENNGGRIKFHGDVPKVFHDLPEVSRGFHVIEMFTKDSVLKDRDKDLMVYGVYSDPGLDKDLLCVNDSKKAMWDVYDTIDGSYIESLGSLVNDMEPRVGPMHLMDFVVYTANALKPLASDSKELINDSDMGYVAPGLCWDKELDFKIAEWPAFRGLRYKDFETSRAIKIELNDGKTYTLGKHYEQMGNLSNGFSRFIRHVRSIHDYMHSCYSFADVTSERVGGKFSEDFAGPVTWSKALDFDVKDWPEFKGIRYIDFKDCTNVHFLQKNGESIPMEEVPYKRLNQVYNAMKYRMAQTLGMIAEPKKEVEKKPDRKHHFRK